VIDEKTVDKMLGFSVRHYLLYKSMVGDSSDNIKGIKGIGPVKAKRIIIGAGKSVKKLRISSEEKTILHRNKFLMAIGAMVDDNDISQIKKLYKKQLKKKTNFKKIEIEFARMNFSMILNKFTQWKHDFQGLM